MIIFDVSGRDRRATEHRPRLHLSRVTPVKQVRQWLLKSDYVLGSATVSVSALAIGLTDRNPFHAQ